MLPNRAVIKGKPREQWPVIDNTYTFLFSLYANDVVRLRQKNAAFFGYFSGLT